MIMEQKTEQMNAKKIRWNISKAMACVYQALNDSRLKIKKTKQYTSAMENQREIDRLKAALQEEKLKCIQNQVRKSIDRS